MTLHEMRGYLSAALAANPDSDLCWVFTSPGPHRLPVRPRLLAERADGARTYGLTSAQVRELLSLIEDEIATHTATHTYTLSNDQRLAGPTEEQA